MPRTVPRRLGTFLAAMLLVAGGFPATVPPVAALSTTVVISQVYGGGGNTGAPYRNDFVELFNRGTTTASLAGWSVQYASATGTGNFSGNPIAALSGSLAPGQYYLVQLASGGANGALLPTPDATGTAAMSATAGKVALVNTTTGLACNGGSTPCTPAQLATIVDLIGWGNANFFEGAVGPATSNTTAALRNGGGCAETDNNAADFTAGAPNPRNTTSPLSPCSTPPAITTQPTDQTACAGSSVTFSAAASGSPVPTVQWQESADGGGTWGDALGAVNPSLTFTASVAQTGYRYRAVFTNPFGTATSDAATLTVNTAPAITTQPLDQSVNDGQPVSFSAEASGSPAPTVQWQESIAGGTTWADIPGATSSPLTFAAAVTLTGNRYRAAFTNTCGTATTDAATLAVSVPPVVISQVYGGGGNSGATLKNDFIELFNRGTTTVSLAGWSVQYASTTGVNWFRTSLSGSIAPGQYYLVQQRQGAGGTVDLPAPDAIGDIAVDQAAAKVVLVTNQTTISTGTVCPSGSWIVDLVGYGAGTNCFEGPGPAPTISNPTAALRLGEGCIDTNNNAADFAIGAPNPRNTASPLNSCTAPSVTIQPVDQAVCTGSSVSFSAASSGSPAPTVQWQESADGATWGDIPGATSGSLTFTAGTSQAGYRYRAVFANALGTAVSDAATLTVNTSPAITAQPADLTVGDGQTATFIAAASGSPAPTVQWQESTDGAAWGDVPGAMSPSLTFTATLAQTGYRYHAVFANTCGTATTAAATLTVMPIAVMPPTLPDASQGVPYSQALSAVNGTPPYTFALAAGALPPGLALSAAGVLSGTPTAAGTFAFTVTATDSNGRSGSRGYSLAARYRFSGFLWPVRNPPTINVVFAGSLVPMSFSLDGYQGKDIFAAGIPASQPVSCSTLEPLGPLTPTRPPGASGLMYIPLVKLYKYLWVTDWSWGGTCRAFVMTLKDGTTHRAYFRFIPLVGGPYPPGPCHGTTPACLR